MPTTLFRKANWVYVRCGWCEVVAPSLRLHSTGGFATTRPMYRAISTIGADAVRRLYGAEGDGIVWAILGSGIDASHPHFTKHSNLAPSPFRSFVLRVTAAMTALSLKDDENRALQDENGLGTIDRWNCSWRVGRKA